MTTDKSNIAQDETRAPVRVWAPKIGDKVKLRTMEAYSALGLPAWTTLHVTGIDTPYQTYDGLFETRVVCVRSLTANGAQDGELVTVPLSTIERPIGWKDRYTITVSADKVESVLSWFRDRRGIAVLQSHYMPSCPTAFAPADNQTADWRFNGASVDVVAANDCNKVFRVVQLETWTDIGLPCACPYCVDGKRTREKSPNLQDRDIDSCETCGAAAGFSFDHVWHFKEQDCRTVRKPAECWVCNGTGKGIRCLSSMDRKEKAQARKQFAAEGWDVRYVNHGEQSYWVGERETVVKDWDTPVAGNEVQV